MITASNIKLSPMGSIAYNACDKEGCERGTPTVKGGRKPGLIYSVWMITAEGVAHCESSNVMTHERYSEKIPADRLVPWSRSTHP